MVASDYNKHTRARNISLHRKTHSCLRLGCLTELNIMFVLDFVSFVSSVPSVGTLKKKKLQRSLVLLKTINKLFDRREDDAKHHQGQPAGFQTRQVF